MDRQTTMRLIPYDAHVNIRVAEPALTPEQCLRAAEAAGLQAVGLITRFSEIQSSPDQWRKRLEVLGRSSGVQLLAGVRAEILDISGHLDISSGAAQQFPLVLAHLSERTAGIGHDVPVRWERLVDNIFAALLDVVDDGRCNVLAYPFNLGRFPAPITPAQLPVERVEQLGDAMAEAEIACELSNRAWWWYPELSVAQFTEDFAQVLQAFSRCGVKFIAGSDSHDVSGVGNLRYVQRLMGAAGVELSQLVDLTRL